MGTREFPGNHVWEKIEVDPLEPKPEQIEQPLSFFKELRNNIDMLSQRSPRSQENSLSTILQTLPDPPKEHYSKALKDMQMYRGLQESEVQQKLAKMRRIDFFDEIVKVNPCLNKTVIENSDPNAAIAYCLEHMQKTRHQSMNLGSSNVHWNISLIFLIVTIEPETTHEDMLTTKKQEQDHHELCVLRSETLDESYTRGDELLDLSLNKKSKSDTWPEYEASSRGVLTPINYDRKKVVFFLSKKRLVVGFDRVENLIDTHMDEEEYGPENNRDILREIKNLNYDNQPYYFPNFA